MQNILYFIVEHSSFIKYDLIKSSQKVSILIFFSMNFIIFCQHLFHNIFLFMARKKYVIILDKLILFV